MKAAMIFTGTGPILILASYGDLGAPDFVSKLRSKNIMKCIVHELPVSLCRERYGANFDLVAEDLAAVNDLRVLDYNGHHVFHSFSFSEIGEPVLRVEHTVRVD